MKKAEHDAWETKTAATRMEKALERLEDTSNPRRRWKTVCKVARRRDGEQRVAGGGCNEEAVLDFQQED